MKGEKGIGGAVTAGDGLSEELTEEAFSMYYLKLLHEIWLLSLVIVEAVLVWHFNGKGVWSIYYCSEVRVESPWKLHWNGLEVMLIEHFGLIQSCKYITWVLFTLLVKFENLHIVKTQI